MKYLARVVCLYIKKNVCGKTYKYESYESYVRTRRSAKSRRDPLKDEKRREKTSAMHCCTVDVYAGWQVHIPCWCIKWTPFRLIGRCTCTDLF